MPPRSAPSPSSSAGVKVLTFGCRLNTYESEVMRSYAEEAQLRDTIIINTCAVTNEAERQARQAIRRARRDHPHAKIIVTGCSVQLDPQGYARMPEVTQVWGNQEKMRKSTFHLIEGFQDNPLEAHPRLQVGNIDQARDLPSPLLEGFEGHTRAFLQIQNGCDHSCTFCATTLARGPSRSVPMGEIVHQIQKLTGKGCQEIVLTGVDITGYGSDLPGTPTLGQMVRRVLALVPDLKRLRLSSLDPAEIDPDLYHTIAHEPRLLPYFHLSVQAGDDLTLARMKRRHRRKHVIDVCQKIRSLRPDAVFGADFIAGFPTETETMFQKTLDLIQECTLTYLHIFPYSPRPGTPAARMPQVPLKDRKNRAATLRDLGNRQLDLYLQSLIGHQARVLVEADGTGRTEHYAPAVLLASSLPAEFSARGKILVTDIVGVQNQTLQVTLRNA